MMRRVGAVALLAVVCGVLSGCGVYPGIGIFDRAQAPQDALPAGAFAQLDASTVRYVGADSDGDRYWVARSAGNSSSSLCIVDQPAALGAGSSVVCGGLPLSSVATTGKTVEFANAPVTLSTGTAELVGNTLLVGRDALFVGDPGTGVGTGTGTPPVVSG